MTRVSENSSTASLKYALNKTKEKVEDLQLKGSTLKSITKPSDNPVSNVEAMSLTSATNDNIQYLKNADFALLNLSVSEKSIEELTEIVVKAKEIAIAQSSDFFNADIRKNVANEVQQLYNQSLAISNKKVGLKHIFSGTKTLTVPFDSNGTYQGDKGHVSLEVSRNFFVPINLTGEEVFFNNSEIGKAENPLENFEQFQDKNIKINRDLASADETEKLEATTEDKAFQSRDNLFSQLQALTSALENNDPKMIQGLLEKFDNTISRLVTLRTRIGSIVNSVETSKNSLTSENIDHASRRSALVDADVTELFSDINKQQAILKTTYQASQGVMNQTLMDFLR
ncbi:MAG: flagellar hook-associated protein FlgL [Bacteriovoracaceae bacterium]|nr:flagellar hook-associated protein FlgL [Bacteriovoracaceae bacterium]